MNNMFSRSSLASCYTKTEKGVIKLNKKNTILILMFFIFSQVIHPIHEIISLASEVKEDFVKIIDEKSNEYDKKLFTIQLGNQIDYDALEIRMPDDSKFNEELLLKEIDSEDVDFNETENKIIFNKINFSSIKLELSNFKIKDNRIIVTALKNGNRVNEYKYDFITDLSESNTIEEEPVIASFNLLDKNNLARVSNNELEELKSDIKIVPVIDTIESGNDALFKIVLKVTGANTISKKATLDISWEAREDITFEQSMEDLKIENVIPTYIKEKNLLRYSFDNLAPGITYETLFKLKTINGYFPNNDSVKVNAYMTFEDGVEKKDVSAITVKSSLPVTISKKALGAEHNNAPSLPVLNSYVKWDINVSLPYSETGQMLINPNSEIIIEDILPKELEYASDKLVSGTEKALVENGKLVWKFKAPSIEEQLNNKKTLFERKISFWTKIKNNKNYIDTEVKNTAYVKVTPIDNKALNPIPSDSDSIYIVNSNNPNLGSGGTAVYPSHLGPLNGIGDRGNYNERDPDPTVYDDAYLQFSFNYYGAEYAKEHDMRDVIITYTIDKNLILQKFSPPLNKWVYGYDDEERKKNISLNDKVNYYYVFHFIDKNNKPDTITFKDFPVDSEFTLKDIGLSKGARVTKIEMIFPGTVPKRIANRTNTQFFFTVVPGTVGEVRNKIDISGYSTYDAKNKSYRKAGDFEHFNWRDDDFQKFNGKNFLGDRTAQIKSKPDLNNISPIVKLETELLNQSNGIVQEGNNRLQVKLLNLKESKGSLTKKIESVILLPPGVVTKSEPNAVLVDNTGIPIDGTYKVIDENYNNTGRQLIQFIWNEEYLRTDQYLAAQVDVEILPNAPSNLYFDAYAFVGNKNIQVPNSTKPTITDSVIQTDSDDLNKDGKKGLRVKTSNLYSLANTYNLQTEKSVKTSTGEWGTFTEVKPGEMVDYKLNMTNTTGKDISSMTLIDVLPSVNDLGITDNINRNSKFNLYMQGPIKLPEEWIGKVDVFYSNEKNPKRDELIRETNYPSGTKPLGNPENSKAPNWKTESQITNWKDIYSFKVELRPGVRWIKGVDMNIIYSMKAPKLEEIKDKSILDAKISPLERAAWNSFAVATDKGQPVEPQRVGVYMTDNIGKLTIKKIDSNTKKELPNAEFEIKSEDGKHTYHITTNNNGLGDIGELPFGNYTVKETKAPNGYNLLNKPINFSITSEKSEVTLTIENTSQGWDLPNTGGIGTLIFYVIGGSIMLSGGWMMFRQARYKSK